MPMHPRPIEETSNPLIPSLRLCICVPWVTESSFYRVNYSKLRGAPQSCLPAHGSFHRKRLARDRTATRQHNNERGQPRRIIELKEPRKLLARQTRCARFTPLRFGSEDP